MNFTDILKKQAAGVAGKLLLGGCCLLSMHALAQPAMEPERNNYTSFRPVEKNITATLLENTPEKFQQHPEFGVLPYRAGCYDCVELVQKRSLYSRYFIEPNDSGHYYVQQSYTPLHYRTRAGHLQSFDPRLRPVPNKQNEFAALSQPTPVTYNKNNFTTSITAGDLTYAFNKRVSMYPVITTGEKGTAVPVNYSSTTVGENGMYTTNGWDKVSVEQEVEVGSVKTTFIIHEPLDLPQNSQYVIFEDVVSLPEGFEVKRGKHGGMYKDYWMGDLQVSDTRGIEYIQYKRPKYFDRNRLGIPGFYDVKKEGNDYRILTMVPVEWLQNPATQYPVYIDPVVLSGRDSLGAFLDYTLPDTVNFGAYMAFSRSPFSCVSTLTVTAPGKTTLLNAYVDLEYKYSDSINCAIVTPTHPSYFCYFVDIEQQVLGPCGGGSFQCDTANTPIYVGTCTTDPDKASGAHAHAFPGLIDCIAPQCADYVLDFELHNRTFQCQETCNYRCAFGSFFAITIEGRTIDLESEVNPDTICIGQEVQLISKLLHGVPDYRHYWTVIGQGDTVPSLNSRDTTTAPVISVFPQQTTTYIDTAYDICNTYFDADTVTVVVKPTPNAEAGDTTLLCDGDAPAQIGGNPTGPAGASIIWTAQPPSANSFISNNTDPRPAITFPAGTTGEFLFIVEVEDSFCFQLDTAVVDVAALPLPVIEADTMRVCEGDTITLSVADTFAVYDWSTGETTNSISVTQSGTYTLNVTNANGCTATANSPQVTIVSPLAFRIDPKGASIELGDTVTLRASINLEGSTVSSYIWTPSEFISCTDCPNPVVSPPVDEWYYLEVTSTDSCISSDSLQIRVVLPDEYWIPTAFSPNADSNNDQFYILKASGVTVKEFKVFNRWGQLIHDDPSQPWDGTFKAEPQEIGVYSYLFVLGLFEKGDKVAAGNVTLVR